jgi:hypothetical protein
VSDYYRRSSSKILGCKEKKNRKYGIEKKENRCRK